MENQNILVVDDDHATRSLIAEALQFEGYVVKTAAEGSGALKLLETFCPCVVLLDARMPGLGGLSLVDRLHRLGIDVQIILMTGATDGPAWARQIQATAFLPKPFDLGELLSLIGRLCPLPIA